MKKLVHYELLEKVEDYHVVYIKHVLDHLKQRKLLTHETYKNYLELILVQLKLVNDNFC